MKAVLSWLNDLAPVGHDAAALAPTLTVLGMQVEDVVTVGNTVDGVITARVLRTERHPDAAKVHRVWVDAGDGVERHVWCGAFNMAAGDVIPLATPGTAMPDGRLIEPRPILNIESQGMLCSARELGLGDDHSGILILPEGTAVGIPYGEALGIETEVAFDIDADGVLSVSARDWAWHWLLRWRHPWSTVRRVRHRCTSRREAGVVGSPPWCCRACRWANRRHGWRAA